MARTLLLRGLAAAAAWAALAPAARAQSFAVSWYTVDDGGATLSAGPTFSVGGTIGQPDAGPTMSVGTLTLTGGFWTAFAGLVGQADLAVTKTDGQGAAIPGQLVTYTIVVTNTGPDSVVGATVADTPPAFLGNVTWTCAASPGSSCSQSGSGSINQPVSLLQGGSATYVLTGTLAPAASGTLVNSASVTPPTGVTDPVLGNNAATDTDTITPAVPALAEGELVHGTRLQADLAAPGGIADEDVYRISQKPHASYEVLVDAASGDLAPGLALDRLGPDGVTVLQSAEPGVGASRSLRFRNLGPTPINDQYIRIRSSSCGPSCSSQDVYTIRAWETTAAASRFNNSATQITILVLDNPTSEAVDMEVAFWSPGGTLLGVFDPAPLAAHGTLALNTATVPGVAGASGSITVASSAPYGALSGKAVAVEPATGFTFDTPLLPRPR
jgi:uncharacterized repeat protein (TIGR01451 family)